MDLDLWLANARLAELRHAAATERFALCIRRGGCTRRGPSAPRRRG